ncbi:MAG: flagellar basal body-associated protein FliL [SAR86 cluster bacterium]|uniref:Flagellar protein FliL n=1 Tax=SAR86 cluster bacterium TaxID=2030880 RepID=A0A2A4MT27_9GAMM|nr:MAG: flagellar basal body-associated protein FliL [SAR86 cluster bacterium]
MRKILDTVSAVTLGLLLMVSVGASAQDEEVVETEDLVYVDLRPTFISNYARGTRLKYLKTDIALRVTRDREDTVLYHLAYIRNALVMLLSEQEEENLTSTLGKEVLRREALDEVKRVMSYLEPGSASDIREIYFTSFIVQQ